VALALVWRAVVVQDEVDDAVSTCTLLETDAEAEAEVEAALLETELYLGLEMPNWVESLAH
jgi:hypothetical protein